MQTRTELAELQTRLGVTTVYVTHDQVEAMTMGHRVAVLLDGVLQQCDTPTKLYHEPANLFVAGFIGSPAMNVLPSPGPGPLRIAGEEVGVGADLTATRSAIGFRPEALSVGSGPLRARIRTVEDLGPEVFVHVLVDHEGEERRLVAKVPAPFIGAIDDNVSLSLNGSVHVFGEDGERIATVLSHPGLDVEIAGESV